MVVLGEAVFVLVTVDVERGVVVVVMLVYGESQYELGIHYGLTYSGC